MTGPALRGRGAVWLLIVALSLGACGSLTVPDIDPQAPPRATAAATTVATTVATPSSPVAAGTPSPSAPPVPSAPPAPSAPAATRAALQLPPGFPTRFPLPPRAQVASASAGIMEFSVVLTVPSAAEAFSFYRVALFQAGYRAREGSPRPRGAVVPGQTVRPVGSLIFTIGTGDEESEPGGIDCLTSPQGDTVEISLPRVGLAARPAPGSATPATAPGPATTTPGRGSPTARPASKALAMPPPFPWPPNYREPSFARSGDGVLTVTAMVPSGADAYGFYQGALVQAGYQAREVWRPDPSSPIFIGRLAFAGQGQTGRLTVNADATTARVTIRFTGGA